MVKIPKKHDIVKEHEIALARKEYIERGLAAGKSRIQLYEAQKGTPIATRKQEFLRNIRFLKNEPIVYAPKYTPKKYDVVRLEGELNPNPQRENYQYWLKYKVQLNKITDKHGKPIKEDRFAIINSETKLTRSQLDKLSQGIFRKGLKTAKKRKGKNYMDFIVLSTPVITKILRREKIDKI